VRSTGSGPPGSTQREGGPEGTSLRSSTSVIAQSGASGGCGHAALSSTHLIRAPCWLGVAVYCSSHGACLPACLLTLRRDSAWRLVARAVGCRALSWRRELSSHSSIQGEEGRNPSRDSARSRRVRQSGGYAGRRCCMADTRADIMGSGGAQLSEANVDRSCGVKGAWHKCGSQCNACQD
jgi:hypothetical protein